MEGDGEVRRQRSQFAKVVHVLGAGHRGAGQVQFDRVLLGLQQGAEGGDQQVVAFAVAAHEEAADGQAAMDQLHGDKEFDLALVDWNMPVMNGLDMLKTCRAEGYSSLKVMMVTTEAENDFILRALDAGADEYLMKPFDDEALTEKLAMLGLVEA